MSRGEGVRKRIGKKKAFLLVLYVIYIAFILMFTIPYFAAKDPIIEEQPYGARVTFYEDGSYGHFQNVVLEDKDIEGMIDFEYHFDTNTLYIQRIHNIQELEIDCEKMYRDKCYEILGKDPGALGDDYYKTYFQETNDGLFTVIINSDTSINRLTFSNAPLPKSVLVNNMEWWKTNNEKLIIDGDDITVTSIPKGMTTVNIYFNKEFAGGPTAYFAASKPTALPDEVIRFDATESEGEIEYFIWNFGDGSEGSGRSVEYSYSETGSYVVTLNVRDNNYYEDFYVMTIDVISK